MKPRSTEEIINRAMTQLTKQELYKIDLIETIARTVHAATGASHDCDCPHKPWNERSEESKRNMRWFVMHCRWFLEDHVSTERIPRKLHLEFLKEWKNNAGLVYGERKTKTTHPLLIPYNQLPDSAILNYKLLVSITKTMVEHYKWEEI